MIPKTGCSCDFESFCLNCFQYKTKFFLVSNFFWHHIHIFLTKLLSSCRQPVKKKVKTMSVKILYQEKFGFMKKRPTIILIWYDVKFLSHWYIILYTKVQNTPIAINQIGWLFIFLGLGYGNQYQIWSFKSRDTKSNLTFH